MASLNVEPPSDDAPPPYTPIGTAPPLLDPTLDDIASSYLFRPSSVPDYSAASLQSFADYSGSGLRPPREPLEVHTLMVYTQSQSRDYRRVPRCLRSGPNRISQSDWKTFIEHLFPPQFAPAAIQDQLPRHVRAQITRDRKDCPQEMDADRRARIEAVIRDWNIFFFQPRNKQIGFQYIPVAIPPPNNGLCPRCYPSSTKLMISRRSPVSHSSHIGGLSVTEHDDRRSAGQRRSSELPWSTESAPSSPSIPGQPSPSLGYRFRDFAAQVAEQAQQCSQRVNGQAIVHGKWAEEQARAYGQLMERRTRARQEWKQRRANFFEDMWDKYRDSFQTRPVPIPKERCASLCEPIAEPRRSLGSRSLASNISSLSAPCPNQIIICKEDDYLGRWSYQRRSQYWDVDTKYDDMDYNNLDKALLWPS
ncbi:hypothetical protein AAP_00906 [Ascosphaera apis ARSEF 7405]|uniref:Uncharacterized protein n=1 Tax=Ascosphaera apis ARSEF 7405 TaxID=392613 RepID=A0A168D1I2_9EURO|nr:hypothetical protein AAP_00906 [Ascosphaera apis ARSEF 7405]